MPQRMAMPAMQFFSGEQKGIPKGWKKVASESRPGEFSFLNLKTGKKYDKLPATGGNFYDDERDTTAKPAWNPFAAEEAKANMEFRSDAEAAGNQIPLRTCHHALAHHACSHASLNPYRTP